MAMRQFVRPLLVSRCAHQPAISIRRYSAAVDQKYENILVSEPKPGVALITLNRPRALNALSTTLFNDLNAALRSYDESSDVGAVVLTGSEKAFAAGADIKEMKDLSFADAFNTNFISSWTSTISSFRKPIIAAVNGHALGGGCELALMTDIIYCSATASFGQPEIKLGTIPGAGGSQRLTKIIGKSRAMDLILTGRNFSGVDAERWGVATRCFDGPQECVDGAITTAAKIASLSRVAVIAAKEVVNKSQDLGVRDGVEYERKVFHSLFGSKDQKIGMTAFAKKDKPEWAHE